MLELQTLAIESVVIHKIPKVRRADKESTPLELTEAPIELTSDLKLFFRQRVTRSLEKGRFVAVYQKPDPDSGQTPSPTPRLVVEYFKSNTDNLVETSRRWLRLCTTGRAATPRMACS